MRLLDSDKFTISFTVFISNIHNFYQILMRFIIMSTNLHFSLVLFQEYFLLLNAAIDQILN